MNNIFELIPRFFQKYFGPPLKHWNPEVKFQETIFHKSYPPKIEIEMSKLDLITKLLLRNCKDDGKLTGFDVPPNMKDTAIIKRVIELVGIKGNNPPDYLAHNVPQVKPKGIFSCFFDNSFLNL
jgi:hypothetical protein